MLKIKDTIMIAVMIRSSIYRISVINYGRAKLEIFIHNKVLFKKTIFYRAKLIKKYRKDSGPIKFEEIVI